MVRKTKEEANITKENIIKAAEECFCENGVNLSSFDLIAKKAKCTRGAIYWHFKDKSELLTHVIQNVRWSLISELKELLSKDKNILKSLISILKGCIIDLSTNIHVQNYLKLNIYRSEETQHYTPLKISLSKLMEDLELLVKNIIRLSIKKGEISATENPDAITNILLYSFFGTIQTFFLMDKDQKPLMDFIDILNYILMVLPLN